MAVGNLRKEAERRGMAGGRLIFADRMESLPEHLARLKVADLFLDTFPYNAHATAIDALWAGVPLLTYPGESFASRVAASLLRTAGLPELVAATPEEYEEKAVALAMDPTGLGAARRKLAQGLRRCSTRQRTRGISRGYIRRCTSATIGPAPRTSQRTARRLISGPGCVLRFKSVPVLLLI